MTYDLYPGQLFSLPVCVGGTVIWLSSQQFSLCKGLSQLSGACDFIQSQVITLTFGVFSEIQDVGKMWQMYSGGIHVVCSIFDICAGPAWRLNAGDTGKHAGCSSQY